MTPRSDDPDVAPGPVPVSAAAGGEIWDTREELLLASALKRHGTGSWDSVSMEMQSRCVSAADARFTPSGCRQRALLLHRRFAAGGGGDDDGDPDAAAADALVEKLRKLRCDELRRAVEQHDLLIGSLQSKVKRLEEERERSNSGKRTPAVKEEAEDEEAVHATGSPKDDDLAGADRVSGGESGRSCKESNSTDLKPRPGNDAGTASPSAAGDGDAEAREEEAAGGESVSVKREETSGESVAGSKEADATKENSDEQSWASPSRQASWLTERHGEGGKDAEEALPSTSAPAALPALEAEALSVFLESVRTSKPGSVFERRLESQDDANYRSTIRRHVDLETIRSKLEVGGSGPRYSSASEFYRDLLLLCTNALVFFPRGSPEHAAAVQTRALVSKHMSASLRKDQPGTSGMAAAAPSAASKKPKADADVGSLLEKTAPIIVCRKRSSITKAAAAKAEKVKEETEEDQEDDAKNMVATKEKTRGLRTTKTRGGLTRKAAPRPKAGKDSESESVAAEGTKKSDKKGGRGAATGGVAKKRNAVDFLNRMKQNSGPSTERVSLLETLKLSAAAEEKKPGKGEARKESGSGSKRGGKATPPGRRMGRPPKRAAAPPSPPPSKRARGSGKRGGKK